MTVRGRHALITGGSRGIGRGIALKLADHGVRIAVNYLRDEAAAKATLAQIRAHGSDGFTVQADVGRPADLERMFARVKEEFGGLDIFVSNARGEVSTFYEPAMSIGLEKFDAAMDSQAKAFLLAARAAAEQMDRGDASSPLPTRRAASTGAGSRGWRWAPRSRPWRSSAVTSR